MADASTLFLSRRDLILGAVASLYLLMLFLDASPVQRTQEARVLVTAREMTESGFARWLVPKMNGEMRLQKPPLAYWLAAFMFKVFGVHEWSARIPFALAGWFTTLLTFIAARRQLGDRAALLATCILLSSLLFYRHARLAETDVLVTLFVTAAILLIWRLMDGCSRPFVASHLIGASIGLTILAKGLPAVFPLAFFITICAARHDFAPLKRWLLTGAPLTALLIGVPWFIYILRVAGTQIVGEELDNTTRGGDHFGFFWNYFPMLIRSTLPWTLLGAAALIASIRHLRASREIQSLLAWIGSIFVLLCIPGNKQIHYLLPMMPPLAILTGWWIDDALRRRDTTLLRVLLAVTVACIVVASIALIPIARSDRGDVLTLDVVVSFTSISLSSFVVWIALRGSVHVAVGSFALLCIAIIPVLLGKWTPTLRPISSNTVASHIRDLGATRYCFFGSNISMPLVFQLRAIVPMIEDPTELRRQPDDVLVIAQTKSSRSPPDVPVEFKLIHQITTEDQRFDLYRLKP